MRALINDSHEVSDTFLRIRQVRSITGLSRGSIYRKMPLGEFPKAVKLSSMAVGWSSREVRDWMAERIRERDASPTKH